MNKQIKLANPRGFCAGVDRAIDIVNKALDICLLYTSPSPRDVEESRMPSSA